MLFYVTLEVHPALAFLLVCVNCCSYVAAPAGACSAALFPLFYPFFFPRLNAGCLNYKSLFLPHPQEDMVGRAIKAGSDSDIIYQQITKGKTCLNCVRCSFTAATSHTKACF